MVSDYFITNDGFETKPEDWKYNNARDFDSPIQPFPPQAGKE